MLSRVADSIYWINRYIERAENIARVIDVNLQLSLDMPAEAAEQWRAVVATTGDQAMFEEHFDGYRRENVIEFLAFDPDNPNSILACLNGARDNARSVREVISSEMWEEVNRSYLFVRQSAFGEREFMSAPHAFFTQIKRSCHLFAGVMDATMSHNEAWHFGLVGRFMERADKTSRIIDVKYFILLPDVTYVGSAYDDIQWSALLRSASAFEMYRKRYGRIEPLQVAEFLVLDQDFPRAIRYCLGRAEESLHAISGSPMRGFRNVAEQRLGRLRSDLDFAQIEEIVNHGLHEFLDGFQAELNTVGAAVFETFFSLPQRAGARQTQESA